MNFEKFWTYYISKPTTEFTEETIQLFSQPFSNDIYKEYDCVEVVIEFSVHHGQANHFEAIERFAKVLKENHPKVYAESVSYISNRLLKYYCFTEQNEPLRTQIKEYAAYDFDLDTTWPVLLSTIAYGHQDKCALVFEKLTKAIKDNPDYIPNAEFELAISRAFIEIEAIYDRSQGAVMDWTGFTELTEKLGLHFNPGFLQNLEKGLTSEFPAIGKILLEEGITESSMAIMQGAFLKMMKQRNCSFTTSHHLGHFLTDHFEQTKRTDPRKCFKFRKTEFGSYINSFRNFFYEELEIQALILWGSFHFIDFLALVGVYNKDLQKSQKKIIDSLRKDFMSTYNEQLWEFSFVHTWSPYEEKNPDQLAAEIATFKKSFKKTSAVPSF